LVVVFPTDHPPTTFRGGSEETAIIGEAPITVKHHLANTIWPVDDRRKPEPSKTLAFAGTLRIVTL
jgi:hypothetical protein